MSENIVYKNWQVERDAKDIAWLTLRYAEGTTNVLAYEVMLELRTIIETLLQQMPKGVVIQSGYDNGFIAGANIHEFLELKTPQAAYERLRFGQEIFAQLEKITCPTVALINGFCMGGGLELALACRYRIALDDPKTRLGVPEILLGIHPGWGGTVRLPLLIGAPTALDLILSGRGINAKSAKRIGLVDAVVPKREFFRAAEYYIARQPSKHKLRGWLAWSNAKWVRPIVAHFTHRQIAQKANSEHYPAPYAALKLWEQVGPSAQDAFEKEAESVSQLVTRPTAENLIRVYLLQERLKKFAKRQENPPKRVHIVGSGTMGGDIAAWCALQGFQVTVYDQSLPMLANTRKRAYALFSKKLATKVEVNYALDRLIMDTWADTGVGAGVRTADVIIEAVPEKLELKQKVWKIIEETAKPDALLATNTSSIPLATIAEHLKQPPRLLGIHFFNPVAAMQLVEVVSTAQTEENSVQRAFQFLKMINHFPLPVQSSPGFLVNRVLTPYLLEAAALLAEGVSASNIDQAAKQFGMPMGPIEMADIVGLDVCLAVAEYLASYYNWSIPEILRTYVAAGKLGRKTGEGFYKYNQGKKHEVGVSSPNAVNITENAMIDRMIMRMLNEACACWREKIVADADLVDVGMIYGSGFAPFRGGPMHYAQNLGIEIVVQKLRGLQEQYGDRFKPDAGWLSLSD